MTTFDMHMMDMEDIAQGVEILNKMLDREARKLKRLVRRVYISKIWLRTAEEDGDMELMRIHKRKLRKARVKARSCLQRLQAVKQAILLLDTQLRKRKYQVFNYLLAIVHFLYFLVY